MSKAQKEKRDMITVWVRGKKELKAKLALQGRTITGWIQEEIDKYLAKK